jgi:esterase/lipase superfamily enzyme
MSKRRTRKEKEKAKHKFLYQWPQSEDGSKTQPTGASNEPAVKGQISKVKKHKKHKSTKDKMAVYTENIDDLASIKKNIGKSVILASLILSLELVIYLIWR